MVFGLTAFRRNRVLRKARIDEKEWTRVVNRFAFLRCLSSEERERLRRWVILFLHDKQLVAAGGVELTDRVRLSIAAQACILVLNLDIDWLRGWEEVIVYPDEFIPKGEFRDEAGVVHSELAPASGESWEGGPVVLSWADVQWRDESLGYNVVIHEFAHKLDQLEGESDGCPPLHRGMRRREWARAFHEAYDDFCARVDGGEDTDIDPYAAENPSEFFAVMSESFFLLPRVVREEYPGVYAQLCLFYRQDPAARSKE